MQRSPIPGIPPFVDKLYNMLKGGEGVEDISGVISWSPDGMRIKLHQLDRFSSIVLPRYFKTSKTPTLQYASFLRQLNIYNFRTTAGGGNRSGRGVVVVGSGQREYEHRHFQKGQPQLLRLITREKTNTARGESGPSGGSYSSSSPPGSHVKESHTQPQSIPPPLPLSVRGRERTKDDPHSERRGGGGGGYGGGASGGEGYGDGGGDFDDRRGRWV
jgi:hypothetical protein